MFIDFFIPLYVTSYLRVSKRNIINKFPFIYKYKNGGKFTTINTIKRESSLLRHKLFNGAAQLVGARGRLSVAAYSVEALNHFLVLHTLYKAAYSLKIAVAATVECDVYNASVLARQLNEARAGSCCCVCYLFHSPLVLNARA